MTAYVVLKLEEPLSWLQGPTVDALSAEAAIRKAINDTGGTYAAVPLRSFQPMTVEVEVKRTVKVEAIGQDVPEPEAATLSEEEADAIAAQAADEALAAMGGVDL